MTVWRATNPDARDFPVDMGFANLCIMKTGNSEQKIANYDILKKNIHQVFHFLYTYVVMVDISSFTIDEFAQAFQDKDSLLLGKIHVALLKLLLSNVENQESTLEFWKRSLAKPFNMDINTASSTGCRWFWFKARCKAKGLARVLLEQGIHGLKVSELAKSLQICELNLSSGIEELESLIGSTLSSDITLFEKISSSTYRVRINSSEKKVEESQSNTEDSSGAVDDDLGDSGTCSSDADSGCNSGNSKIKKLTYMNHGKNKDNMVIV
ncbi:hypothetical protein L3X38_016173 [Prunus dulcis]|uniref:DDT domain-containing protein n=1 Tax=Prunus dulcis TaxID=3755 RepID=A0AAD4W6E6_PRUDU|nr:hypothetical protein L3X38_016173 [Prunus dulcis]